MRARSWQAEFPARNFFHPEAPSLAARVQAPPVLPCFLPRLGCPQRCLYCHQEAQTGQPRTHLPQVLERLRALLKERQRKGCAPVELAF